MSQTYTDNCFQSGNVGQTDLQNIENNFAALKSNFSGTGAPPNAVAGMEWFDTDADTGNKGILKLRNNDGTWYGLLHGDTTHRIPVYRNTAIDGWAVVAAAGDRLMAIKGGSTYTTGGASAGSWTISGINTESAHYHTHNHQWYQSNAADVDDESWASNGTTEVTISRMTKTSAVSYIYAVDASGSNALGQDYWTKDGSETGTAHTHTHDGTDRLLAYVMTLQYIDI